jgi:hypothetical protein
MLFGEIHNAISRRVRLRVQVQAQAQAPDNAMPCAVQGPRYDIIGSRTAPSVVPRYH